MGRATYAYVDIACAPLAVAGRVPVEKELGGEYFGPGCERKSVGMHSYYATAQERALFQAIDVLGDENDFEVNLQGRIFAPEDGEFGSWRWIQLRRRGVKGRATAEEREHRRKNERLVHTYLLAEVWPNDA